MQDIEYNLICESLRNHRLYDVIIQAEKFISMNHPNYQKLNIINEILDYWEELQWFFSYFRFPMIEKRLRTGDLPLGYKMLRNFYNKHNNTQKI
jgi:hypothetical protein